MEEVVVCFDHMCNGFLNATHEGKECFQHTPDGWEPHADVELGEEWLVVIVGGIRKFGDKELGWYLVYPKQRFSWKKAMKRHREEELTRLETEAEGHMRKSMLKGEPLEP